MERTITCKCDNRMDVDVPETVNLSNEPQTVEDILEGRFFAFTCDSCGTVLKPEIPVRIVWPEQGVDIFFVPELERSAYLRGKSRYPEANRVVIGYPELVEKIRIFRDDLDDRVVELLKYHLMQKAPPSSEVTIYYQGRQGDELVFHVHGLRKEEIGVSRVPFPAYKRLASELSEKMQSEPYSEFLSPPYVSVNTIAREEE